MTAKESKIGLVMAGLLLSILMASMDNTIVATAMGTIVADLGDMEKFIWVTSAYMVAEMAGMPIFGKLSDMYGRKRFFLFGMIVFLIGSILCGTAQTIEQLSVYRAIQGIGGGALVPITFTIIFDIFPPEKRGKMTGLFGAVFGLSSIFGPLLGAYITDYISWHWVFYINLPLGITAFILILANYKESLEHKKQSIDWLGAVTLVGAVICLMFALELGGNKYDWNSVQILSLFSGFALLIIIFLAAERKASDPIVSYDMFKNRLFAASTLVGLFYGIAFIVASVYIPIFIQGVNGGTATNSGLILLPMMLGVVVSSQVGAIFAAKLGYRNVMTVFAVIFAAGMYLLTTIDTGTSRTWITVYMVIVGLGTGASFSVLSMAAIHHVDPSNRGSANSTISFVRQLGMTVGITIFGIIQRNDFTDKMKEAFSGFGKMAPGTGNIDDPRAILSQELRSKIPAPVLDKITDALAGSIAHAFTWALIPAALVVVFVFMLTNDKLSMPQGKKESTQS
ncbi:EmrB/QacA subfamily drug resistance transporter [Peribacillus deserti]|uniref:EmrB/QacA subfamily drug resistance transporter n=1 Tax=Peribacillus deserti TaxID=673318 RepID=A0ABS2QDV1_9BACI|nr:MDR family MFS transporter [Peribacillus deserti]MBM7691341.1 EmrB/QacA subfamily drug resistance transporter [Peribacillus deserti]